CSERGNFKEGNHLLQLRKAWSHCTRMHPPKKRKEPKKKNVTVKMANLEEKGGGAIPKSITQSQGVANVITHCQQTPCIINGRKCTAFVDTKASTSFIAK